MKNYLLMIVAGLLAYGLSGCATPTDVQIVQSNTDRVTSHNATQNNVATTKANAIVGVYSQLASGCTSDTAACGALKAMSSMSAARDLASIQTQDYKGPTDKTGVDVQDKLVDKVGAQIPIAIVATEQARKGTGSQTDNINSGGGAISLDHSLTRTDQVGINTGSGSQGNGASPADTKTSDSNNPATTDTTSTTADSGNTNSTINH